MAVPDKAPGRSRGGGRWARAVTASSRTWCGLSYGTGVRKPTGAAACRRPLLDLPCANGRGCEYWPYATDLTVADMTKAEEEQRSGECSR